MRTLHVDTGREMRGGQWQALYLLERLKDATLLAPAQSPLLSEARKRGLEAYPLSVVALAKMARRADLVHAHDAKAHTLAALAGGAPLVVSRRVGFAVRRSIGSRWKYARAARYLAVSRYVAARLSGAGVQEERIRVVYDGVPIPSPGRAEPGRIVALASKSGAIPGFAIHSAGDLWQDLSTASVFLYVTEMEGLGSAALAAMAAGVPVIATRVGGLPEIVEHERTGLLVDSPPAPEELAAAVQRLLDDPALAAEMGRQGREKVKRQFSIEAMVEGTLRVYEEVGR
jgi:glycosyl transferase family 1/glycosyl transferase family 4